MANMYRVAAVSASGLAMLVLVGCSGETKPVAVRKAPAAVAATIQKAPFGKTTEGVAVDIYTLTNTQGAKARIMTYGGIVVSLEVPDKAGKIGDVVLGYDKLEDYIANNPYFGALVGRYGNRIAKGKFNLDGKEYTLATNNDANHLHGGIKGFDKVVWVAKPVKTAEGPSLELTYVSKDTEEGYPGNLSIKATYVLSNKNELKVIFAATTDKPTVCNLTHNSCFNLAGPGERDILDHEVMFAADHFTPVDAGLIPTGELRPVKDTPFDFNTPTKIGARVNKDNEQLTFGKGYDHNWVITEKGSQLKLMARVTEPTSGRVMEVRSTDPGLQFYCGNFLDGSNVGKGGTVYKYRHGFCMEPQHFPDSPNHPDFPTTTLRPDQAYAHTIVYAFSTM